MNNKNNNGFKKENNLVDYSFYPDCEDIYNTKKGTQLDFPKVANVKSIHKKREVGKRELVKWN